MSIIKNKNSKSSIMISIFILGIGLIAGFFLTMGNYIAQAKLLRNLNDPLNVIKYEGKLAECTNNNDKCIKIGGGGKIERLE